MVRTAYENSTCTDIKVNYPPGIVPTSVYLLYVQYGTVQYNKSTQCLFVLLSFISKSAQSILSIGTANHIIIRHNNILIVHWKEGKK